MGEIGRGGEGEQETLTHASDAAFKIGKTIARCESELTPSEPHFTAEDVVREALKIAMRDQPDIADKIDKNALIDRVRGKLYQARLACGESSGTGEQWNSKAEGDEITRVSSELKAATGGSLG